MNSQQWVDHHHRNTLPVRKSNLRLNDQIIPKPTDINMGEKIIKVATPKEHPYASHIPHYTMFPSYASSEEQPNVRFPAPKSAPDVTLLSKTKGSAYRHEILKPLTRAKKAVTWAGDHGFLEYPKPLKADNQFYYPTPKTLFQPKSKVDLPSSAEIHNMRRNLERTHWLTSYQMHYSGYEKGALMKDNVRKHMGPSGRNSDTGPQRDKPVPAFVSTKLEDSYRRPEDVSAEMIGSPAPLPVPAAASLQRSVKSAALPLQPQESSVHHNDERGLNQRGRIESGHSGGSAQAQRGDLSHRESHKQRDKGLQSEDNISKSRVHAALEDGGKDFNKDAKNLTSHTVQPDPVSSQQHILPGIGSVSEGLSLKELQDSYSKTRAHRRFNSSATRTSVNPRDNVFTGRRHDFYGVNAFYLHG